MKSKFFSLLSFSFSLMCIFGVGASVLAASYACECQNGAKSTVADCSQCASVCKAALINSTQKSCTAIADLVETPHTDLATVRLDNPLNVSSPTVLIGNVINAILGVVGSLALLMFVLGGITWMTSSGSQEKVKKGRDIIVWSIVGLAVIFLAYALTRFILSVIAG